MRQVRARVERRIMDLVEKGVLQNLAYIYGVDVRLEATCLVIRQPPLANLLLQLYLLLVYGALKQH
jgi:hypothetical protein